MPAFFILIQSVPFLASLLFSVWTAWSFRLLPCPPLWGIFCLLIFGVGSIRLLYIGEISQFSIVLLTVLSAILCIAVALALSCRRWLGKSHPKSWVIAAMIVLPIAMWSDFRFRIIVIDGIGRPVEVDAKTINFHRPNSFLKEFRYGYGTTVKRGVMYFGFCQWVMFRGDWIIFGRVGDPHGSTTHFQILNPEWNKWPIRLTVKSP